MFWLWHIWRGLFCEVTKTLTQKMTPGSCGNPMKPSCSKVFILTPWSWWEAQLKNCFFCFPRYLANKKNENQQLSSWNLVKLCDIFGNERDWLEGRQNRRLCHAAAFGADFGAGRGGSACQCVLERDIRIRGVGWGDFWFFYWTYLWLYVSTNLSISPIQYLLF